MLDKKDYQAIREIVREEISSEVTKIVKVEIQKQLKPIKKDIVHIRKDQKAIVNLFDREYLDLRNRVERIEDHLNLPALSR